MEESRLLFELKFISAMNLDKLIHLLCKETVSFISVFSSDPLFSCIVTFCVLILLYLPRLFWRIVFSPVLVLTGILLLIILRLGAIQRSEEVQKENKYESEPIANQENGGSREEKLGKPIEPVETNSNDQVHCWITNHSEIEFKSKVGFESSSCFEGSFVEWNVKAPLEVIFEEYEGEEAEQDPKEKQDTSIFRYPSLSRYFPETDSDTSSENGFPATGNWDSPEKLCFSWDEEDREGLIEIALDGFKKRTLEFHFEEENLIEIDISPTRHREFPGEDELFSGAISYN